MERKYRKKTAKGRLSYAKKFSHCLINRDLSELQLLSPDKRVHVMKALAALSKFLGVYEDFKALIKNYGFTWKGRNSDDRIIERLTKIKKPNEIFNWIKEVKRKLPELDCFVSLMTATGLRFVEAIESYNLIINLTELGRLNEYYDCEKEVLQHYKFKEVFIRDSKKAFISFLPTDLVVAIGKQETLRYNCVQNKVKRRTGLRFSDVREAHASFFTKYLTTPEIDFIHGRVSASVFMRSYFNPALIGDLKERVFRGLQEMRRLT